MNSPYLYKVRLSVLVLSILSLILAVSCSDEAKNDAAKLEQELMDKKADSIAADSAAMESAATAEMNLDVQAVPEEEPISYGTTESGYALQVASCESSEYAQYLMDKYVGRGYQAYQTTFDHNGQTFFRVRLGPYETKAEAEKTKAEILDRYSVEGWIEVE